MGTFWRGSRWEYGPQLYSVSLSVLKIYFYVLYVQRIAQRNSPLPILRRLPLNAASLQFGSFICSDSLSSSPTASPLHGSCLTTSQLCTPIGSPASRESLTPRQGRRQWNKEPSPLVISSHQEQLDMQEKKGNRQ